MLVNFFYLLLIAILTSCANQPIIDRTPSSKKEQICTNLVGKIFEEVGFKFNSEDEQKYKKLSITKIREKYTHFSEEQASKHFDLLKSSCL